MIAPPRSKSNCACKYPKRDDSSETQRAWDRRLALYAVASGALLGLPGTAQASIITNILPTPTVVNSNGSLTLDFDGDGTDDLLLSATATLGGGAVAGISVVSAEGLNGALIGLDAAGFYAAPVGGPDMISGVASWSGRGVFVNATTMYSKSSSGTTKITGPWTIGNGSRHWFAAQFPLSSGLTTTGWADLGAFAGKGSAQLTLYATAYDDAPPASTPEPCTMALFAAGSAGILAWRRRKAATSK